MEFTKLRLSGFKSFVEATEFPIETGLTGVVGPNGCGKSNLFEALRWVMGASSARAMRGEGMDDVIFAGGGTRPSRNHAEVVLTIDNADHRAPAEFNLHSVLEVARRIDRGEGSSYRINGAEARARDVQLLFADASTGANSPALVRQGQISELIAARPQNRRRILEEAAGVSGLHGRRHEAELKVRGAEANLTRVDDVARELEASLARLRREARAAARYARLAAEIRALRGAVLHARWVEAKEALDRTSAQERAAGAAAGVAAGAAAQASARALDAAAAIGPLREEETASAAILHRLAIEKDRLDRALEDAAAGVERLAGEARRIERDLEREARAVEDAGEATRRLEREARALAGEIAAAPERLPLLEAEVGRTEVARAQAEADVESLATSAAAAEAAGRSAAERMAEAGARLDRTRLALERATAERASLSAPAVERLDEARAARAAAEVALQALRVALDQADARRAEAAGHEGEARAAARDLQDRLGALEAEAAGLSRLIAAPPGESFAGVLDRLSPRPGCEAALAAALGDDVNAALDGRAAAFWAGAAAEPPVWPPGAEPLAPLVEAPAELAARLAFTALVARGDGPRLQVGLPPGARLVSREGDLWRWDGLTVRAEAPRPAQVRLEQRARKAQVAGEIEVLGPQARDALARHAATQAALADAERDVAAARAAPRPAEAALARARQDLENLERQDAQLAARRQSLGEIIERLEAEIAEAEAATASARKAQEAATADPALGGRLASARSAAATAREAAATARSILEAERRERQSRADRLAAVNQEREAWTARAAAAAARRHELTGEREATRLALEQAAHAPEAVESRRRLLLDDLATAESRRARAGDALAAAETARAQADGRSRAADQAAGQARESLAALAARLEAARERLGDQARAVVEATGQEPGALGEALAAQAVAIPTDADGAEAHLAALERDRDGLGAVNLRAEEEVAELAERLRVMAVERDDLAGALARLRTAIAELNAEGRERLLEAFEVIDGHFRALFTTLFQGGQAELRLVESEDPLEAGLEILACPPGKRMAVMSLMSGGEQALTAVALIFAVFLANPAPICVLDEVDAPLDDANVERFCDLLDEMRRRATTRFITITHNPLTMSRMDRLFGVTMPEPGVSQLVSVDLRVAEALAAQ